MSSKRGWNSSEAGLHSVFTRFEWRYTDCKETLTHTHTHGLFLFDNTFSLAPPASYQHSGILQYITRYSTWSYRASSLYPLTQSQKNKNVKVQSGGSNAHVISFTCK